MSSNVPPKTNEAPDTVAHPSPPEKKIMLAIALGLDKIDVSEDEKTTSFPNVNGEPDMQSLVGTLKAWKERFPDRKDIVLATDSKAKYKYLVLLMDTLIIQQFPDVGINLN
jgi:biopolymer transport protein ExbD